MNRERFETGMWRLFLATWSLACVGGLVATVVYLLEDRGKHREIGITEVANIAGIYIVPPVLAMCIRWVYRGFFPRKES